MDCDEAVLLRSDHMSSTRISESDENFSLMLVSILRDGISFPYFQSTTTLDKATSVRCTSLQAS